MQGYNDSTPKSEESKVRDFARVSSVFVRRTPAKWNFCAPPTTTRGAWVSAKKESYSARQPIVTPAFTCQFPIDTTNGSAAGLGRLCWTTSPTTYLFDPITENVRQVDQHGGYTAGAGHALYTARNYPQQYWNRTAFVNGPTGHLVGTFVLRADGSDFKSTSPFNLVASDDEWTAPIMAEVGPDGNVWMIDWYNYIVQHNPTPQGFETGKGNAYETDLRDKKYGRVYRVVYGDQTDSAFDPGRSDAGKTG